MAQAISAPDPLVDYMTESDLASNALLDSETCDDLQANYEGYVIEARDAEKFVTSSVVFLGDVITGSFIPADPTDSNPCSASGSAYLYRFDIDCGEGHYVPGTDDTDNSHYVSIGNGIPTPPRVSAGDLTGEGSGTGCDNRVVVVTSDGSVSNECQGSSSSSGINIRSWRQR